MSDCLPFDELQCQTMRRAGGTRGTHGISGLRPTVSFGSTAGQSIVAAGVRKKIYCKTSAYQ